MVDELYLVFVLHWDGAETGSEFEEYGEVVPEDVVATRRVYFKAPFVAIAMHAGGIDRFSDIYFT